MDTQLLSQIAKLPGAPGFEKPVRDFLIEKIAPYADSIETDNMGNLIVFKKGTASDKKKVMAAAHMDEIGFIVKYIDDNGFLYFHTLGGFDPKTLTAQRVTVHAKTKDLTGVMGSKPIHVMSQEERQKNPKTDDYFIDLGMNKEEVEKYVQIGDPITRERDLIEMGDCVNSKSLDNRVSVYILAEALKALQDQPIPYDFYAVFTVQEEVGLRGANVAAQQIDPDFGIALDTTIAYDLPGARPQEQVTALGKGTGIKIMDAMTICDPRMVEFMKKTADKNQIDWQAELLTGGGTDTAGLQRMGQRGSIAGAISVPTRHLHQVIEMCHKKDIQDSIDLLVALVKTIDKNDWSH
ncbi:MAG: M42 family metallopeptidase [Cytophagales bacterium]|nr:M42 family metallopeptidase [Cytophagales bacterium]